MKSMARLILKVMSTTIQTTIQTTMKITFVIAACTPPRSIPALLQVRLKIDLSRPAAMTTIFRRWQPLPSCVRPIVNRITPR